MRNQQLLIGEKLTPGNILQRSYASRLLGFLGSRYQAASSSQLIAPLSLNEFLLLNSPFEY